MKLYGTENVPPIPKEVADERLKLLNKNLKALANNSYTEEK